MTWKSHCVVNAAVALALTGRFEAALAAMSTAALPDQLERFLPLGRHRGFSHLLVLWVVVAVWVPLYAPPEVIRWLSLLAVPRAHALPQLQTAVGTALVGLSLGPVLHVFFDGCSHAGVPVAPFSRQRLRLGLYKTRSRQRPWNVSEAVFLALIFAVCACSYRVRHLF